MSVIYQERERRLDGRLLVFPILLGLALIVMFLRLWYLQVVRADELRGQAQMLQRSVVERLAPRGLIVDRKGRLLAGIRSAIILTARPREVLNNPAGMHTVAGLLAIDPKDLKEKILAEAWRPYVPAPVHLNVPVDVATLIAESPERFPGFAVESQPMRTYGEHGWLANILGYVWTPSKEDVERLREKGVEPAKYVGKTGLEKTYDVALLGRPGEDHVEVDNKRRPVRTVSTTQGAPGRRLILSLDAELQRFAQTLLAGRRGGIVALEPSTGQVLALVSAPTYDGSLFQGGIKARDWAMLRDDPAHPLLNRPIYAAYAPGSTFKVITSIAAAQSGRFDPRQSVLCAGYYQIGSRRFRCMGRHGAVSFRRAMAKSCNTYFASMGMAVGPDALRKACAHVGLGAPTGIDIPGEGRGIVPTLEWIAKWRRPPVWYGGDTVNFSVGQGEVSATPIQMASVAAMVANRGRTFRPHLVREIIDPVTGHHESVRPQPLGEVNAGADFWNALADSMVAVIEEGTAGQARIPGIVWGGKTGSAENRRDRETHSWFIGFAPADNPRIAIAVVVENAGHGGDVAAPIAGQVVRRYLMPTAPSPNPAVVATR